MFKHRLQGNVKGLFRNQLTTILLTHPFNYHFNRSCIRLQCLTEGLFETCSSCISVLDCKDNQISSPLEHRSTLIYIIRSEHIGN